MGVDGALLRRPAPRRAGLTFAKLLGTGDGRTFTLRDADLGHWGLLTCWVPPGDGHGVDGRSAGRHGDGSPDRPDDAADHGVLAGLEATRTVRAWDRLSHERLRVVLRPLASRGRWAGREPFGKPPPHRAEGPVASITRARLRPRLARTFWRAVPPVSQDLHRVDGLRLAVGIGEAPVGLQGTFSLWDDARRLDAFAYRRAAHADVVRRTAELGWYAEELFARFAVVSIDGTFAGRAP